MTATGRRPTRQQAAVADAVGKSGDFISAQELHARMRAAGNTIGLATVYRSLAALAAEGALDVLRTDDGEAVYRQCSTHHHHHLVCRTCGRTIEVAGPTVESWADRVASEHGFRDVRHTVEIVGTCGSC
jgi:Fur family ferric uptake transcriptional regulator